jgi:hypothetical protein
MAPWYLRSVALALLALTALLLQLCISVGGSVSQPVLPELFWHRKARNIVEHAALGPSKALHLQQFLSDYNFTLPLMYLKRGLAYQGAASRVRRLLHTLAENPAASIKVGVVGGSISWGHGVRRGVADWFSVFGEWMVSAWREGRVLFLSRATHLRPRWGSTRCCTRSGEGGTPSKLHLDTHARHQRMHARRFEHVQAASFPNATLSFKNGCVPGKCMHLG